MSSEYKSDKQGGMPSHIAIIMDGNGRWAKERGLERIEGHKEGITSVRSVMEGCVDMGIKHLTLYAFSKENWTRPQKEVDTLMNLFIEGLMGEKETLVKNGIRFRVLGDMNDISEKLRLKIEEVTNATSRNTVLNLYIALSYSGRWEIVNAVRSILAREDRFDFKNFSVRDFESHLCTCGIPDPDLIIRTGGEYRLSNFLLWQSAYSELYFIDKFWPEFKKEDLSLAVRNYQLRERRYGKTGEQIKNDTDENENSAF